MSATTTVPGSAVTVGDYINPVKNPWVLPGEVLALRPHSASPDYRIAEIKRTARSGSIRMETVVIVGANSYSLGRTA